MKMDHDWTKEEVDEFITQKLKNKEWIKAYSKDCEKELFEYQKQKYSEHEKEIYTILYNSMMAIDAPKTLVFPSPKYMESLDKKYFKKVNFLKYKDNKNEVDLEQYYGKHNNILDFFSRLIQDNLLDIIENNVKNKSKFADRSDLLKKQLKNKNYCKETYDLCFKEVERLYKGYTEQRQKADTECNKKNKELWKNMKYMKDEVGCWGKFEEDEYWAGREINRRVRYEEYKKIDIKYIPEAEKVLKTFDSDTVSQAIANLEKCTENFILSLFFKQLKNKGARYVYQKCEDGDIEFLFEKYKKIEVENFDNSRNIESLVQEDKIRLKVEQKIRFKINDNSIIEEIKNCIENGQPYKLSINDTRVEAFEEFSYVIKDKDILKIIKFGTKKNGELAISKKSFGVIVEV